MTPYALQKAQNAIDREDIAVYDLCADIGQIFGNIKHMRWFVKYVARELYEEEAQP